VAAGAAFQSETELAELIVELFDVELAPHSHDSGFPRLLASIQLAFSVVTVFIQKI
jgi:hypothetical protein